MRLDLYTMLPCMWSGLFAAACQWRSTPMARQTHRASNLRTLTCTSSPMTDLLSMRAQRPTLEPQPMMLSATRAKSLICARGAAHARLSEEAADHGQ